MTEVLNPQWYRSLVGEPITRDNIDSLLDNRGIQAHMSNGRWWVIRRNGVTRRWKRNAKRIAIPYKAGMYTYGLITEKDFVPEKPKRAESLFDTLARDGIG